MHQIIFHVNEEGKEKMIFNSLQSLMNDLGEDIEVEVVTNSKGVKVFLKDHNPYLERIEAFKKKKVTFMVCNNTLKKLSLQQDDFIEGIEFIPSGAGEIIRKQGAGWSYIKL